MGFLGVSYKAALALNGFTTLISTLPFLNIVCSDLGAKGGGSIQTAGRHMARSSLGGYGVFSVIRFVRDSERADEWMLNSKISDAYAAPSAMK